MISRLIFAGRAVGTGLLGSGLQGHGGGESDGEQQGQGEPEGVVGEAGGSPGSGHGADEEGEADEGELAGFGEALRAEGGVGRESAVEEAVGEFAQVAGDEGRVVGEAADLAEGRDLQGGDERDGGSKEQLRERKREQASDGEGKDLERKDKEGGLTLRTEPQEAGAGDAGEEGNEGDDVAKGLAPILRDEADAEEDDVAGHGVGEDTAVEEVDDGIEQAAGGGEEDGGAERSWRRRIGGSSGHAWIG